MVAFSNAEMTLHNAKSNFIKSAKILLNSNYEHQEYMYFLFIYNRYTVW